MTIFTTEDSAYKDRGLILNKAPIARVGVVSPILDVTFRKMNPFVYSVINLKIFDKFLRQVLFAY